MIKLLYKKLIYRLNKLIDYILFGKIRMHVVSQEESVIYEAEYIGRFNKVVGYWAYGNFEPDYPYPKNTKTRKY